MQVATGMSMTVPCFTLLYAGFGCGVFSPGIVAGSTDELTAGAITFQKCRPDSGPPTHRHLPSFWAF